MGQPLNSIDLYAVHCTFKKTILCSLTDAFFVDMFCQHFSEKYVIVRLNEYYEEIWKYVIFTCHDSEGHCHCRAL